LLYLEKKGVDHRTLVAYALSVAAALVVIALWPYYSLFANLLKIVTGEMAGTSDYQSTQHYLYAKFLVRSGPALLGIPCILLFTKQKRFLMLVGGFVIFSLIYLTGYVYRVSLAERFVFFIMFSLQMAASRICREWFSQFVPAVHQSLKRISAWFLLLCLIIGMGIQLVLVYTKFVSPAFERTAGFTFPRHVNPNAMQMELRKYLGESDVVLSDIYTSWSLPVYTGAKIIALYHTSPHISDNTERKKAVETFYDSSTSPAARKEILKRYGVTHLLLNFKTAGKALEPVLRAMNFEVVARNESFCLFSVAPRNAPSLTRGAH
jgi:alpha-1,6-mannosyltransferase